MKPQTLKGFRDFLPAEAIKRQYVINILKSVFESYGFSPLETPALEYEDILMGKYGEEGDKLMYRFTDLGGRRVALRYDQTVPLARVVAQYGSTSSSQALPMPFKRYQIQPVWRAENTQKGRLREFLQCDIDTVGSESKLADAEVLAVVYDCFKKLGLDIIIKINDRSLLTKYESKVLNSIDKLKKLNEDGVIKELEQKGITNAKEILKEIQTLKKSCNISEIESYYLQMGYPSDSIDFDSTIIRGLDYYTGLIMEVILKSDNNSLSLGGGGRYDKLIGMFAGRDIPAVGFAFGFDRLIQAMEELNLFPKDLVTTKVLVTIFSPELIDESIKICSQLRSNNIATELYLDTNKKLDAQLKYADKKRIPYALIIGPEEKAKGLVMLKNLKEKSQKLIKLEELISLITN